MHHSLLLFEANKGITFVWSQYWTSKSRHWLNFIWLHINKSTKISKSFQDQGWIVFTNFWMVGVSVVLMYLEQLGLSNIYTIIGHRKAIRIWFQPRACAHAMCVCVCTRAPSEGECWVDWCGPDICPGNCAVIWVGGCPGARFYVCNIIYIWKSCI